MAKMMMGQIDHARNRVRAIKAELLGSSPKSEKKYDLDDLAKGLRDGTVKFTGPQLAAFNEEWVEKLFEERSRYNQPNLEDFLLNAAFSTERAIEKARWETENDIYQIRFKKVCDEATKVEDAIVLGDHAAALAALVAFAAFAL